jgi:hypothetical protein
MLVIYEPNRVRAGRLTISIISSDLELGVIFKEFSDEVLLATHDVHEFTLAKIKSGLDWFWIDLVDYRETVVTLEGDSHLVVDPSSLGSSFDSHARDPSPMIRQLVRYRTVEVSSQSL